MEFEIGLAVVVEFEAERGGTDGNGVKSKGFAVGVEGFGVD